MAGTFRYTDGAIGGGSESTIYVADGQTLESVYDPNQTLVIGPGIGGAATGEFGYEQPVGGSGALFNKNAVALNDVSSFRIDLDGAQGSATITGGNQGDDLVGGQGEDSLYGGGGDDTLQGSGVNKGAGGADTLDGGSGYDTASYANYGPITVDLIADTVSRGNDSPDKLISIERVLGGLEGDTFVMSADADDLDGGGNFGFSGPNGDTLDYSQSNAAVNVNLATNVVSGGYAEGDIISNFENVIGSDYADTLVGNDSSNILDGGKGADTLIGGLGDDIYRLDSVGDVVTESAEQGTDTVIVGVSGYTMADNVEILRMAGSGNFEATGNALDNTMVGNKGNNVLDGGAGADRMYGGLGNDLYYVDNAKDVIIERADGGVDDVVGVSVSYRLGSTSHVEILGAFDAQGTDAINLTGNDFDQAIFGNAGTNVMQGLGGRDYISAGEGNDRIYGGTGNDTLTGGDGNDTFVFNTALDAGNNLDTILDFSKASGNNDRMLLDDAVFTALTSRTLSADQFLDDNSDLATSVDHRIIYNQSTGALFYDADGAGGADGVQFATLINNANLGLSDFVIV